MDQVRVLRVIEYVGDREFIENTVAGSIHGTKHIHGKRGKMTIRAATITGYPEILEPSKEPEPESEQPDKP